jgi:hypothetical protein
MGSFSAIAALLLPRINTAAMPSSHHVRVTSCSARLPDVLMMSQALRPAMAGPDMARDILHINHIDTVSFDG